MSTEEEFRSLEQGGDLAMIRSVALKQQQQLLKDLVSQEESTRKPAYEKFAMQIKDALSTKPKLSVVEKNIQDKKQWNVLVHDGESDDIATLLMQLNSLEKEDSLAIVCTGKNMSEVFSNTIKAIENFCEEYPEKKEELLKGVKIIAVKDQQGYEQHKELKESIEVTIPEDYRSIIHGLDKDKVTLVDFSAAEQTIGKILGSDSVVKDVNIIAKASSDLLGFIKKCQRLVINPSGMNAVTEELKGILNTLGVVDEKKSEQLSKAFGVDYYKSLLEGQSEKNAVFVCMAAREKPWQLRALDCKEEKVVEPEIVGFKMNNPTFTKAVKCFMDLEDKTELLDKIKPAKLEDIESYIEEQNNLKDLKSALDGEYSIVDSDNGESKKRNLTTQEKLEFLSSLSKLSEYYKKQPNEAVYGAARDFCASSTTPGKVADLIVAIREIQEDQGQVTKESVKKMLEDKNNSNNARILGLNIDNLLNADTGKTTKNELIKKLLEHAYNINNGNVDKIVENILQKQDKKDIKTYLLTLSNDITPKISDILVVDTHISQTEDLFSKAAEFMLGLTQLGFTKLIKGENGVVKCFTADQEEYS